MNRTRKLAIILSLIVLGLSTIYTAVYYQFSSSSNTGIIQPDIVLEQGTSGTSIVYSNETSASINVDSYSTTFFTNNYNVTHGQYVSGSTPNSIEEMDINLFTVNATGSHTSNLAYYPTYYNLLNGTADSFNWGITSSDFTGSFNPTNYRYMGGVSPNITGMKVTKLYIRTTGSGTAAIALYTGGTLSDPTGAVKQTEAYNISVSAGWNEIDVPDYSWPNNTVTWIGYAINTGNYFSTSLADAGDFQTAQGRWSQTNPADANESTPMPTNPGAGSFGAWWYALFAEYEVGSIENLTANDGQSLGFTSYLSAITNLEEVVEDDSTDVDSSPDIGYSSNFTLQKSGPDTLYDTLREAFLGNVTLDYVDNNISDLDSSPDIGTHSNFTEQKKGPDTSYDTLTETQVILNNTLVDNESFEGTWPPSSWTATGGWNAENNQAHDGSYSADIDGGGFPGTSGDLDTPSFNCSGVNAIYVTFWFRDEGLDPTELYLQFWDGGAWDNIQDLTGYSEYTWHYYSLNVTDSQYYVDDFQIRFAATTLGFGEHFYVDEVTIIKEPSLGGPETSGDLITPSVNCTGARSVYISFWFRDEGLDDGELDLEFWNGSTWNNIQSLTGYTESVWNYLELNITDSQYYIEDFQIRFRADTLGYYEYFYVDEVTIMRETQISSDLDLDLEIQWNDITYGLTYEELCIYAGSLGDEDIIVEAWNTTTLDWDIVFSDLSADTWNNASISNWLTSDTFTIRYRGANSTGDTIQDQWEIDIALVHIWEAGTADCSLDMEYQWTSVDFLESSEELCIFAATMGAEDIIVDIWYNNTWNTIFTDLNAGWNNISVTQYLDSSTFTIRMRDEGLSSDASCDTWEVDISLLHLWGETYTAEVEFEGLSNLYEWPQIEWTTDTSYTNSSIRVEIRLYNYTSGSYPVTGNGFLNYTSGTAYTDETKNQVITVKPDDFRNSTGWWNLKIKAEQVAPFELLLDYIALNTTYYDEYTAQTEFLFNDITDSLSPHLNFTTVTHNSLDGATITLQIWNYTTSSYPSSGQGYVSFVSNGVNNTQWLNITNNPSSCIDVTDAKIRVTSIYSTIQNYQQYVNFIRLLQDPIQKLHNYSLRVKNLGTDTYNLRLVSLSETGLTRLINCTILLNSTTQIQVIDGVITLDTGSWTDVPGSSNQDVIIMASSINQDITSTFELILHARKDGTTVIAEYPIYTVIQ